MTQKGNLFKGQQKTKSSIPPNRHGKLSKTRKGKRTVKSTNGTDADRELTKFINRCNEVKAATIATKDGGQLSVVKPQQESTNAAKK